jgi:hypothetical protein
LVGFVVFFVRRITNYRSMKGVHDDSVERRPTGLVLLLAIWGGWTVLQYLGYNLTFVQHQGRYLFPALIPIGLAFGLGLGELLRPVVSRVIGAVFILAAVVLGVAGAASGALGAWPMAIVACAGMALLLWSWLPRRVAAPLQVAPYLALIVLDAVCLFGYVVPHLA